MNRTALLVVALLTAALPSSAFARSWHGIEPGVSHRSAVVDQFGEPSKTVTKGGQNLLGYFAAKQIKGTRQVIFRVDTKSETVARIDVFPGPLVTRSVVESSYGPACTATKTDGCFVEKIDDTRIYLLYPKDGLAVFFKADGKTVFSFVYLPVAAANPAEASNTGSGEQSGETATTTDNDTHADVENAIVSTDTSSSAPSTASDQAALNEDPLKIGALVYMRGDVSFTNASKLKVDEVSAPSLIDAYFDGRPTDRLRAMVLARLTYDPALASTQTSPFGGPAELTGDNPNVQLDQLWLTFDVQRVAFVTVGRQHVKWGAGKFWSPTDFLTPIRADPLSVFDTRLGTDMLKIAIPWEATESNFYVIGLIDTHGPAANPLEVGLAMRAETVILGAELGVDAVFEQNQLPRYGLSLSTALGPIDVHAEAALRKEMPYTLWKTTGSVDPAVGYGSQFAAYRPDKPFAQVSAGLDWKYVINDERSLTFGAEGFYNQIGYDNADVLPWMQITNTYQPFYAGKYYAAAFASYDFQGLLNSTQFVLTGIGNLSDHSVLTRFDAIFQVMTALNVELFAAAPVGKKGGEFRFAFSSPPVAYGNGQVTGPIDLAPEAFELGCGFRLKI